MSEENVSLLVLAVGTALIYDHQLPRKKKRRKRCYWVKPWLEKRYERGAYNGILTEMRLHDQEDFRKYLRMNTDTFQVELVCLYFNRNISISCRLKFLYLYFQELINKVSPILTKQITNMRVPISVEEKLAVTLRFLATGETYESLMYQYRIHRTTIGIFIPEV